VSWWYMLCHNDFFLEFLTNYMTINLNVFGSLIEHNIFQQSVLLPCCHLIVSCDTLGGNQYLSINFWSRLALMSYLSSFCTCAGPIDHTLLLAFSWHKVFSKKDNILSSLHPRSLLLWFIYYLNRDAISLELSSGTLKSSLTPLSG